MRALFGVSTEKFEPHAGKPEWPLAAPEPDRFVTAPEESSFEQRRKRFLRDWLAADGSSLNAAIVAERLGERVEVSDASVADAVKILDAREDCADFTALEVAEALAVDARSHFLKPEQSERLKKSLLGFKFWIDEPGPGAMVFATENHQIVFHAAEYLAAQTFIHDKFANDGRSAAEHKEHAARLIKQWIDRRARWGFSEWDSNVYYSEDLAAAARLAEYAADPVIAKQTAMLTDLLLFDIADGLFKGVYGVSHGRTYQDRTMTGRDTDLASVVYLVWGVGQTDALSGQSGLPLAVSRRYRPPAAIINAGRIIMDEFISYERQGIPLENARDYGLDYNNLDDVVAFWGMGAYTQPQTVVATLSALRKWNLWDQPFAGEAPGFLRNMTPGFWIGLVPRILPIETNRLLLGEANVVTYRTPDYMLSSAQDYRAGEPGNQQHVWQATLGPDAAVFTTNPGSPEAGGDRTPTYWNGQNRFPRIAQYKNVLFAIYKLDNYTIAGQRHFYSYTHAFFPRWAFDRVETRGKWTFGQAGNSYVALYSSHPAEWTKKGRDAGVELVASGKRNVWICVMGRSIVDGTFDRFMATVSEAPLKVSGLRVAFEPPGVGKLRFGWRGKFTLDGRELPMRGFKRFDNPFCQSDFNEGRYIIEAGGKRLSINFGKNYRDVGE